MTPGAPVHVLLVDSSGYEDLGGASTVLNEIIRRVERERFIPVLACLSPGRWPELVRQAGTAAYSFPRSRLRSPGNLATLVLGLRRVARTEHVGLIHASENSALLYASLAGRVTGTPVIWHIHSPLQPRARSERAVARALRLVPPAHIVYTSTGARRRTMPFPGVPWSVVSPGVDLEQCRSGDPERGRGAFGIPGDALVLSMFARVGPMKGQADFVECLGRLAPDYPNLYGVMCGPADKGSAYWRRLQDLVARYDLGERLIIPGDVRPPRKDDLVAGSDIVVHPSHAESFGLAVLEAMAAGRPVVAAATDGPRLLIEDGISGSLVEPGNVDQLTATVRRLLDDPAQRDRLGTAAAGAAQRHGVDDMVRHFESLWDDVLRPQRPPRKGILRRNRT
ncbi:MAG TPA: glycosyltransferase family 4 protein [Acidimicrobiales bacterium]